MLKLFSVKKTKKADCVAKTDKYGTSIQKLIETSLAPSFLIERVGETFIVSQGDAMPYTPDEKEKQDGKRTRPDESKPDIKESKPSRGTEGEGGKAKTPGGKKRASGAKKQKSGRWNR